MVEPSTVIAIIALIGSVFTGLFTLAGKMRKSDCINCTYEAQGDPEVAVIEAMKEQNEVILEQMRQRRDYSKSS